MCVCVRVRACACVCVRVRVRVRVGYVDVLCGHTSNVPPGPLPHRHRHHHRSAMLATKQRASVLKRRTANSQQTLNVCVHPPPHTHTHTYTHHVLQPRMMRHNAMCENAITLARLENGGDYCTMGWRLPQ